MAEVHEVESCVRGYHIYGDSWTPNVDDLLYCERESGNLNDVYAVAIKITATAYTWHEYMPTYTRRAILSSVFPYFGSLLRRIGVIYFPRETFSVANCRALLTPLLAASTSVLDSKEIPAVSCSFFFMVTNFHNVMLREFVRLQCLI